MDVRPGALSTPKLLAVAAILCGMAVEAGTRAAYWHAHANPPRAAISALLAAYSGALAIGSLVQLSAGISRSEYWNSWVALLFRSLVGITLLLYATAGFIASLPDSPAASEAMSAFDFLREMCKPFTSLRIWVFVAIASIGFSITKSAVALDGD